MSIRKYETFVKVVELGSLTKAAEALGMTQSGVSHIINGIEDDFGFSLLVRGRGGVRLTDEGERVLPVMRNIVNCSEQLKQIVDSIHGLDSGTVRVGAFTSVAVHWLPGMIKGFQEKYPRIEFKLLNGDYHDVQQWLGEGSVDVGFVALPCDIGCRCIPLMDDRLLAVLPKDHKYAALDSFPVELAANEPFITLLESSDHDSRRALEALGVKPNVKFTTKDDYAIIAMVEQGLGISIMPELLLKGRDSSLKALELDPPCSRTIGLALASGAEKSPATGSFAEYVCGWIKEKYSAG